MRVAWFSPMPPCPSGIAACSADVLPHLRQDHDIDVYVDEPQAGAARDGGGRRGVAPPQSSAHDFVWRHAREAYDVTVYQVGNSSHHDYQWAYLFRYPGLVVLHDAHLHHARAAALLRQRRAAHYREEFAANQPEVGRDAAELAVAGFDSLAYYEWPFTRLVIRASRATAVHSPILRRRLQEENPGARVEHIRLGHGTLLSETDANTRGAAARSALGIPAEAVLFGVFGGISPEKRVAQVLAAFGSILPYVPGARLLLAGPIAAHFELAAAPAHSAAADRVIVTGYLADDERLTDAVAACDVTLNLRWPTAREVSGPWLRCLAAGRPTVVIDLSHMVHVPCLDPRTWTVAGGGTGEPVAVGIDILDEDHSLRLAMRRLGTDASLRGRLGRAARAYWMAHHAPAAMADDYRRVLDVAAAAPPPSNALPAHLAADPDAAPARWLAPFGVPVPWSKI